MLDAATFIPLVWSIAHKVKRRIYSTTVDVNDLAAAGTIGLMSGIKRYRPRPGSKPASYLGFRIHGAMQDCLRDLDHLSRVDRAELRRRSKAGKPLGPMEPHSGPPRGLVREDESVADRRMAWAAAGLELEDLLGWVRRKANPRAALIFKLCYVDGRTQREVAKSLGISSTFVQRILKDAIRTLRQVADVA